MFFQSPPAPADWMRLSRMVPTRSLVEVLLEDGRLTDAALLEALSEAQEFDVPLADVLLANGALCAKDMAQVLAKQYNLPRADLDQSPPDPAAGPCLNAEFCLAHGVIPWRYSDGILVIAASQPDRFAKMCTDLPPSIGPVVMAVATLDEVHSAIANRFAQCLSHRAETLCPPEDSCRGITASPRRGLYLAGFGIACAALVFTQPHLFFAAALALAVGALVVAQGLKLFSLVASLWPAQPEPTEHPTGPLPKISLLVPLFKEPEILPHLVARLQRLRYPASRLEAVLILEDGDTKTAAALRALDLPVWCHSVTVPGGTVQTKPRAMNYALGFTSGEVIGIYDAEDAPDSNQLMVVAQRFGQSEGTVACLQGVLDFYNPNANWLSRCFALEYASWFCVLLPGMARLGLALPLGGTTVFFRRDALEAVGGWDAHNVTEDADLGLRLARRGYETQIIPTVTQEEANNRLWPWVKQRSRWLKGYGLTWWVHSRAPVQLWQDLGARRFLGVQALFLGTVLQFALAPLLWSFWAIPLGLPHPFAPQGLFGPIAVLIALFLIAEATTMAVALCATARSPHKNLFMWIPTLFLYFPLGTVAIYKALWETLKRPFYWDKTQHGRSRPDGEL